MAQSYINSFSPMTPIGQGLQNITTALFAGRPPVQRGRDEAAMEASRAQALKYQAEAAEAEAKRQMLESQLKGREGFLDSSYGSLLPPDDMHAARNFITGAPVLAFEGQRQPRPGSLTPDVETQLRRAHSLYPAVMAGAPSSTVSDIVKGAGMVQDQGFRDQTARGEMSPTRFMQVNEKMPFAVQDGSLVNIAEGIFGPTSPMGNARIDTQRSMQVENQAQANQANAAAGTNNARARLIDDQRTRLGKTPIGTGGRTARPNDVVVELEDGSTQVMPREDAIAEGFRIIGRPAAVQPRADTVDLKPGQQDAIFSFAATELGVRFVNGAPSGADPEQVEILNDVIAEASRVRSLRVGGAKNEAEAVRMAIKNLGITKERTYWNKNPANKRGAAEPGQAASGRIRQPGAPPARRPAGKTDAQLLDEANAAITKGADRNKVMQRLRDAGVRVD